MKKMGIMGLSLFLLIFLGRAAQACNEGSPVLNFPAVGKSPVDFLPGEWSVEDQVEGDLNGDGISDIVAILIQGKPGSDQGDDERERALLVLLGRDKEKFMLAGKNDKILHCKGCGGIKEGVHAEIKKGIIVVNQMRGSREFTNETLRFRYDPKTRRFVMIGRDFETGDSMRGTGTIVSTNYLTGLKITETYRYDEKGENKIATSTKKGKGPQKAPFLEDVVLDH